LPLNITRDEWHQHITHHTVADQATNNINDAFAHYLNYFLHTFVQMNVCFAPCLLTTKFYYQHHFNLPSSFHQQWAEKQIYFGAIVKHVHES
jgi:hypothetical protein